MLQQKLHIGADPYLMVLGSIVDVGRSIQICPDVVRETIFVWHEKVYGAVAIHRAVCIGQPITL